MELSKLFVLILLFCITIVEGQTEVEYRLLRNVIPSQYKIDLVLEEEFGTTKTFSGDVEILVEIVANTKNITLNSANITYTSNVIIQSTESDDINHEATVELVEPLQRINLLTEADVVAGKYKLIFKDFIGILHEDMHGFYLSSYTTESGIEYIATTQLQSTFARRAFPCFDEPNFKATFLISINRPAGYTTLSNAKLDKTEGNTDTFLETPRMSTYLVAFIISKFKNYGANVDDASDIYDVWCRETALSTAEYSYNVGPKLLEALGTYTGIPYYEMGVTKMDQVAIPDFAAGAMENWGLVTYRETALLWDNEHSTQNNLQRVATVIAHEFAHMWFGDLVTLDWWDYTWLNEGFARYFQYVITMEVEDDWELEKQFVVEQQQVIFASDGLPSAAALSKKALTPSEIDNKFASISYNKGASVIRMMANFLGKDNFQEGIKAYLSNNKYGTTVPETLFTELSKVTPENELPDTLAKIMESWTTNPGYPTVKVSRSDSGLVLSQERFLFDTTVTNDKTTWYVPITYTTEHDPSFESTAVTEWLLPDKDLVIPIENLTGWVIVNLKETGYYRVNYDDELWDALDAALKEDASIFPDINRAQIVDDALNLARINKISYGRALDVTSFLEKEDSYYPWYAAFTAFSFLRKRLDSSEYVGQTLDLHITTMMAKLNETVSFTINEKASHVDVLKTVLVLQWACLLNQPACVEEAEALYEEYKKDESIDPNVRSIVYCSAIRHANTSENWNFLWEQFKKTDLATEQNIILTALGCSQDEDILKEYLGYSISADSNIRKQDAATVFTAVLAGNPTNVDIALKFIDDNIDEVVDYYEGMSALSNVINGIADRLTTEEQIDTFAAFVEKNKGKLQGAALQTETALQAARANIKWAESNMDELTDWFKDVYGSAAQVTLNLSVLAIGLTIVLVNSFN